MKKRTPARPTPYEVYVLLCADGTYYTGIARDADARFRAHRLGTGAAYTRAHPPRRIVYREPAPDRAAALRREYAIKRLTHTAKRALVRRDALAPRRK